MPDLSKRPARYATALVVVAVAGGYVVNAADVRIGPDPALVHVQAENERLKQQVAEAVGGPIQSSRRTCSSFPNQEAAQAFWEEDPLAYPGWDGNSNGLVCEQLKSQTPETVTVTEAEPTPEPADEPALVAARTCSSFPTQEAAQAFWDAAPVTYADWDGNDNGVVCEQLRRQQAPAPAPTSTPPSRRTCSSFPNREAAQAFWDADPATYADWDGNGNGLVCEQLRSQTPEIVTVPRKVTRVVWGGMAPPRERSAPPPQETITAPVAKPTAPPRDTILASRQHFGLFAATTEEYDGLEATLARDTTMQGWFQGWDSDFRPERVNSAWSRGEIPHLTWESRPLSGGDPVVDYSLASIIAGEHDEYLHRYARDIKANGLPLVIRFNAEMNGDWYRWAEANLDYDNAEGSYIAAWRHVHDIFGAHGANELVLWLWSPNRIDNIWRLPSIDNYYPGDDYVDWVGLTGYYRPEDEAPTFDSTYTATLDELRKVAPGKPIIISEAGATESDGHKLEWVEDFFPGLARNPDVIGFGWFNYVVTDEGETNDWRIQSSPDVTDAFRAGLYATGYGRDRGKQPTLITEPPPE